MSFNRNIFFSSSKQSRDINHKWRKFQVSKHPQVVFTETKPKTKMIEVPIEDVNED
ncbi:hypothetical protein KAR91_78070 [Candidatus Pacearchaeota archaeon]|nr:hypothetical protein [Candidatus Pacearchaeota archaeon]